MFNSYSNLNNKININAVSGTLIKNYRDSFFYRFNLNSTHAQEIFNYKNPHLMISCNDSRFAKPKSVVVIQTMVCGDMEVICELMWKEDFDKIFEKEEQ